MPLSRSTTHEVSLSSWSLLRDLPYGLRIELTLSCRKDKALVHILDSMVRLENKVNHLISNRQTHAPSGFSADDFLVRSPDPHPSQPAGLRLQDLDIEQGFFPNLYQTRWHLTVPHRVILWPSVHTLLSESSAQTASDLRSIASRGMSWLLKQEIHRHSEPLPHDAVAPPPHLDLWQIQKLSEAYFNTYNKFCPILDRATFADSVVALAWRNAMQSTDSATILTLLVCALGQMGLEGVAGEPIAVVNGVPSGFRGGTVTMPPGLDMFNEARRRLAFTPTHTLERVQILLLQATYYEANARHLDFWQSIHAASMTCQVLIHTHEIDWQSAKGDLIKRAYWACALHEDLYHRDLDLPRSGIHTLEDRVVLPHFHNMNGGSSESSNGSGDRDMLCRYHFLAMISMRSVITRIHDVVHRGEFSPPCDGVGILWLRYLLTYRSADRII